ncbi:MAG: PIN domain-containing protein [Eubacteriales bacterium]|nr:PIN domain-containing protein [Eubacteriales bacterium]
MRKILRIVFAVIGGFVGYAVYNIGAYIFEMAHMDSVLPFSRNYSVLLFAVVFAVLFYSFFPVMQRRGARLADSMNNDLKGISSGQLIAGTIGLILGLVVATLIAQMFSVLGNRYLRTALTIADYVLFSVLGILVAVSKGSDVANMITSGIHRDSGQQGGTSFSRSLRSVRRRGGASPKILDTSVIIDGRIADIMKTGFLEGEIVIPEFVLVELRHIADSSDSLKRARGRQGLDILKKIQTDFGVEIYNTDSEKSLKEIPEVDVKLLKLAQIIGGKVVTNDYNLNKVAGINGVSVLNINELANCLKPVVLPGEQMSVHLVKRGSNPGQAVAYLSDGTMIVVENGEPKIGKTVRIHVTSALQTAAGRMIFGRME